MDVLSPTCSLNSLFPSFPNIIQTAEYIDSVLAPLGRLFEFRERGQDYLQNFPTASIHPTDIVSILMDGGEDDVISADGTKDGHSRVKAHGNLACVPATHLTCSLHLHQRCDGLDFAEGTYSGPHAKCRHDSMDAEGQGTSVILPVAVF